MEGELSDLEFTFVSVVLRILLSLVCCVYGSLRLATGGTGWGLGCLDEGDGRCCVIDR